MAVAAAAAEAPGATSAEEAAVRAASVLAEAVTTTKRSAQSWQSHSLRHGSNSTYQFLQPKTIVLYFFSVHKKNYKNVGPPFRANK